MIGPKKEGGLTMIYYNIFIGCLGEKNAWFAGTDLGFKEGGFGLTTAEGESC